MKCPECKSEDTKRISTRSEYWKPGLQQCNQCGHQANWGEFCDPPIRIKIETPIIAFPETPNLIISKEEELWIKNKLKK
jgi:hypothetical protein